MTIQYLACGNIMSDRIECQDGSFSEWNMGGPAFYALSGMRIWTKNCKLVCKTGADFRDTYSRWMLENNVSQESVRFELEKHTRYTLKYKPDGSFLPIPSFSGEHLGFLKTHADDIDKAAEGYQIRGIYMANNTDIIVWDNLRRVKEKRGMKIMWEIEYSESCRRQQRLSQYEVLNKIRHVMEVADAWSINCHEASNLFDIPMDNDEAIIQQLQKMPIDFTFYRVGEKGSYAVTKNEAYFCPAVKPFGASVDPTGCGNCSTGSAAFALFSGEHPAMVAAMGNVAAGFNAAQRGPYRLYTAEKMAFAKKLANDCAERIVCHSDKKSGIN